jgi:hypothetical protein
VLKVAFLQTITEVKDKFIAQGRSLQTAYDAWCGPTPARNRGMTKKFEKIPINQKFGLLITTLRMLADSGHGCIEDLARSRGQDPTDLWSDICVDAGFDECEPWQGFPGRPPWPWSSTVHLPAWLITKLR